MRTPGWLVSAALSLFCVGATYAQQPAAAPAALPEPTLEEGRAFTSALTLVPATDEPHFAEVGIPRAFALMMTVVSKGGTGATPAQWVEMHRALDGMIELFTWDKEYFKAAIFADLQNSNYRHDEQDYALALAASRKGLDLQQRSGSTESLYIEYENLGDNLLSLGQLEEAQTAYTEAHQRSATLGNEGAGAIWQKLISLESARGQQTAARDEGAAFLAASTARNVVPQFRGLALLTQANLAVDAGHFAEAIDGVKAALAAMKGDKNEQIFGFNASLTLLSMGTASMEHLPYADATALCKRIALEFPNLPFDISAFAQAALNHRRRLAGEFDALLREDSAEVERAHASANVVQEISALMTLAVDFASVNELDQRLATLEKAETLDILASPGTVPVDLHIRLLRTLGDVYILRKDLKQARLEYFAVTTEIDGIADARVRQGLRGAYGLAQLGQARIAEMDEDPDTARDIYKNALNPPAGAFGTFTRSDVLLASAQMERRLKEQPAETARLYREAIAELHKQQATRDEVAARMQFIRVLAVESPQLPNSAAEAEEQLRLAEAAASDVVLADAQWRLQFLRGLLEENAHRSDAAIAAYRDAVAVLDHIRSGLPSTDQRQAFMDDESVQELYRRLIALLSRSGNKEAAYEYMERDRARAFLETLHGHSFKSVVASRTPRQAPAKPANASAPQADVASQIDALQKQILSAHVELAPENDTILRGTGRQPEAVRVQLKVLEADFTRLRQDEALLSNRATQPLSLRTMTLAEVQRAIPVKSALIEYQMLDGSLAAFVITRTGAVEKQWPADTRTLPGKMSLLHDEMSSSTADASPGGDLDQAMQEAATVLLAPLMSAIPADVDGLLIVPTSTLAAVPFQALPMPGTQQLMIDRFTISYLPSAATLQFLKPYKSGQGAGVFLGALGNVSVEGAPPLPGTLRETDQIAALYPHPLRSTQAAFTHGAALNALQAAPVVHFATHGIFDVESPLFSALLTAPSAGQPSRLSLYEVLDLNLQARLVILSACETNRGRAAGGDEIAGLTRAFLQAGAEDVVSSLWKVSDESTALLMLTLHQGLLAGESPAKALREAELAVRHRFPQPFYWAAFVNTGVL